MDREAYVNALREEREVKLARGASTVDVDAELARYAPEPVAPVVEIALPPRPQRRRPR